MQYILVFGAVFLIMLAVILLFFFLINTTAEDVSGQVRKTFLKEMEVFDELYEEKAKKLKKVRMSTTNSTATFSGKRTMNRNRRRQRLR